MNLRATQAEPAAPPRSAGLKFTYPSGSRPLEGYTIKRGIGRGGFGEVYYAASDAGKEVALKLIRRNLDVELRGVTQCLNLKHPNLLGLFDIRQDELGDSWVVMEYVAGESLEDVIARHPGGMPRDEALAWFSGIAAGVVYLHDRGIVHRDLKPGNIFCDEGLVKIGDYGLSKFISASRRSGQTESVGTVHYMAPEIGNGRYGKEIDIYALGIILYEMLTGRVPFDGESVGEVLMKHLTAEADLSGVDQPFRDAIARTLTKDPEGRIKSVTELLAMLPQSANGSSGAPSAFMGPRSPRVEAAKTEPAAAAPPPRSAQVPVELVDEEPVWRAVRQGASRFASAWNNGEITTAGKAAILVVGLVVLFQLNIGLVPLVAMGLLMYAVYFGVRAIMLAGRGRSAAYRPASPAMPLRTPQPPATTAPAAVPAGQAAAAGAAQQQGVPTSFAYEGANRAAYNRPAATQARMHRSVYAPPVAKTFRERLGELLGSLLLSTGVAAAVCVVMVILRGSAPQPEQFAWLALVSTLGAWSLLVVSKFWEGRSGEPAMRRFVQMVLGLGLGVAAWLASSLLMVQLDYGWGTPRSWNAPIVDVPNFYDGVTQSPSLMGFMAYFAFLLVALRWWRQADPGRLTRLSVFATGTSAMWAWLLYFFWPFPQPWGVMVAITMSVAVQLASPWQSSMRRFNGFDD